MRPPGRCSFQDRLPDELLEAVLRLVPKSTSKILGSAIQLTSR